MPYSSDTRNYEGTFGTFKNDGRHDPKIPLFSGIRFQAPLVLLAILGLVLIFSSFSTH